MQANFHFQKKKKVLAGNEWSDILQNSTQGRKEPPPPPSVFVIASLLLGFFFRHIPPNRAAAGQAESLSSKSHHQHRSRCGQPGIYRLWQHQLEGTLHTRQRLLPEQVCCCSLHAVPGGKVERYVGISACMFVAARSFVQQWKADRYMLVYKVIIQPAVTVVNGR